MILIKRGYTIHSILNNLSSSVHQIAQYLFSNVDLLNGISVRDYYFVGRDFVNWLKFSEYY